MLYLALGIIGATVMPHNLYLHSGIVQTRAYGLDEGSKRQALRMATWDSTIALMFALTINASILILAAATFHTSGNTEIVEIDQAHALLTPLLGGALGAAAVWRGAAVLGAECHGDRHDGGPDRDGGLHRAAHQSGPAAADHPASGDPARHRGDPLGGQRGHRAAC